MKTRNAHHSTGKTGEPGLSAALIDAAEAARLIRAGGVVAMPTETVYGLAADAFNEAAVQRVFAIKCRPALDPLIVHLAEAADLPSVAAQVPPAARRLASVFWPGPLTLVLPKQPSVPDLVTSGLQTVAVRVPLHPLAHEIIRRAGCPVAAPSANPFGAVSPTCAAHVQEALGALLDGIVDGGACAVGVESSIIGFWEGKAWLLRPGGIGLERIEAEIGPVAVYRQRDATDIRAPGTLPRHYAPATPLCFDSQTGAVPIKGRRLGRLIFGPPQDTRQADHVENLSPSGDLEEAAANLYAALRRLDAAGLELILVSALPDAGLGHAINDRLRRAAHGS